jgi:hypothetical protein
MRKVRTSATDEARQQRVQNTVARGERDKNIWGD